ncbi:BESS motif [Nesidiocoris tenuis]|uniref:BESS motif n=1 Tax=Nesidiocoris tenuis TaxID=355587 RepID=A0ABN7AAJ4_9HEMI|nr:BESS motif [Nesidiocoris tenuis]
MSIVDQFLVTRLIDLIRANRCLYDPRQEHHNNRAVINSVWKQIAIEMNQSETLCREKWINLRSNFARELRKTRRKMTEDGVGVGGSNNTSQWIHFEAMMFLAPFVKTRLATADDPLIEPPIRVKIERDPIGIETTPFITGSATTTDDSPSADTTCLDMFISGKRRKYSSPGDSSEEMDDDRLFLLSLLPKMRQLPILENMSFRIEVHSLLLTKLQSCLSQAEEHNSRSGSDYRHVWSSCSPPNSTPGRHESGCESHRQTDGNDDDDEDDDDEEEDNAD